ncbi:Cytochrome P450 [Sesbania bispinosa]|nr:Cytochrome P450 [Sesbania bispinosa]
MDFFLQSLLLILIPFIASIYVLHKRKPCDTKTLPPGSFGWPLVGETYQFLFNKIEHFLQLRVKKYSSEIFKTELLGEPTVVLCGPGANKFISMNEPNLVKVWYLKTQRRFFNLPDASMPKQAVVASAPVKILGFLKPEGLARYMGKRIEPIIDQHFMTHWEGKTELKVYPLVKAFSLTLAYHFYLGIDEPHHVAKFASKFEDLFTGIYSIPVDFPGSKYHRTLKAASEIRKEIQFLIKEKIDGFSKGQVMNDLLAHIVGAEQSGKYVPKIEISNIIMGLMNSSYIPIATTLAFMIKQIGQRPDIYQKILSEHADVRRSKGCCAALDWDSIQKLKYTWAVAQETMRLYPTAPGVFREAVTDITYEGFTIPKGWKIFWAIIGTNKNPKYFHDPESFDPSRFEGNVPAPYTYIPFGAGPRSCPGRDYTRFVILTFIHNLVTKFKWEVIFPDEKVSGAMLPIPSEGIPSRLHHL